MILGLSAGFHDAAITVLDGHGEIQFAGHSERYSKIKNDKNIHASMLDEFNKNSITKIAYYERPWIHNLRCLYTKEPKEIPWRLKPILNKQLGAWATKLPSQCFPHHLSHAAAGFQTSSFDEAAIVVIDAIGEFDTISIFHAHYDKQGRARYEKKWSRMYPHSIGLFYSAVTQQVGLKPMEEEYITMGMAAFADFTHAKLTESRLRKDYIHSVEEVVFSRNCHTGLSDDWSNDWSDENLAAGAQGLVEKLINSVILKAWQITKSSNLVYAGGVALNCVANRHLGRYFDNIWIMPNPGDAGSSLGAAALAYGNRIHWTSAYLGHNIPGPYPVNSLLDSLLADGIVGVANGRAEFGPRALGNRSLLADPRGPDIKERVNKIKRRQQYRPFAPVILEEYVQDYFMLPQSWKSTPYMQVVARCIDPHSFPAIVHVDMTSRVQTVPKDSNLGIRQLLEKWYVMTGCPMLLNTSLNIRGEPMVNDRSDADRFEKLYNVRVYS